MKLVEAGSWVFGNGLHAPETATVLRPKAARAYDAAIARTDNTAERDFLRRSRDLMRSHR